MISRWRNVERVAELTLSVMALLFLASSFGLIQSAASGATRDAIQEAPEQAPPPPGELIDIGGWKLHLNCSGQNKDSSPTVIFESGAGGISLDWYFVQAGVAKFTRACSYDRAGTAWSELGPRPRTLHQDEYELHKLLAAAGIPGPYVLVGHSMGGVMVRIFQAQYSTAVSAMVLVDPFCDDCKLVHFGKLMRLRDDTTGKPIPPVRTMILASEKELSAEEKPQIARMIGSDGRLSQRQSAEPAPIPQAAEIRPHVSPIVPSDIKRLRLWAMQQPGRAIDGSPFTGQEIAELYEARTTRQHVLGDMPLTVIIAAKRQEAPGLPPEWRVSNEEVNRIEEESAKMSTNGKFIYADSGHAVMDEQPLAVIDAIHEVVKAASRRPGK